jgi:hypothetical protein
MATNPTGEGHRMVIWQCAIPFHIADRKNSKRKQRKYMSPKTTKGELTSKLFT